MIKVGNTLTRPRFKPRPMNVIGHRVLVQMEGTAHIDFPKFEMAKAINFKIIPLIHM